MSLPYQLRRIPIPAFLLTLATLAACAQWTRVGEVQKLNPEQEISQLFDPNTLYANLGRLVSPDAVHYIGSVAFVPGHGDSTLAIVGLSLANRAFAFDKQGNAFVARYRVEYQIDHVGIPPIIVGRDENLRVASFQETLRSDESVLLQQNMSLRPGDYQLTVRVRDLSNGATGTATQRLVAPAFGPGTYTAPILAYRVRGRGSRDDSLAIVLNPRGTVAYGGDTLLVYVEGVGFRGPQDVPLQVRDERDSVVVHTSVHFTGATQVESRFIRLAPDSAPLGQLQVLIGPDPAPHKTSALVSFSSAWVVTNFGDLLSLLRYFGEDKRLDAMRKAQGTERDALWREFFHATDPNPSTPENEALDAYFARLAIANQRFRETGTPGWRTDRGEVFIVLGEPDEQVDQSRQLQNNGRFYVWSYTDYRLQLFFQDVSGFGHFQLTASSRADFNQIRARIQHAAP